MAKRRGRGKKTVDKSSPAPTKAPVVEDLSWLKCPGCQKSFENQFEWRGHIRNKACGSSLLNRSEKRI